MRNPDYMAREFIADVPGADAMLRLAARSSAFHRLGRWTFGRVAPGIYWAEVARVKHFDRILLEEVAAGVPQVVILGAGLDSRAYRFASGLDGVRLFEVDHPVTAARKRQRLSAIFGEPPPHVSYVSVDLTDGDPSAALAAAGFDPSVPVLVLWIGVVQYLPAEAVAEQLGWIGRRPPSSSVAFDYYHRAFFGEGGPRTARRVRRGVEKSGERFVGGFDPEEMAALTAAHGLEIRSHLGPREQGERYLLGSDGGLAGPQIDYAHFLHAEVATPPSVTPSFGNNR